MSTFGASFPAIEAALAERYGRPSPDPEASSGARFSDLIAVVLGRSLAPPKAERALAALRDAGLLEPPALAAAELAEVVEVLKEGGVALPPRGLAPVILLARWLVEQHGGTAESLGSEAIATDQVREELRRLSGIGPATADALLLALRHAAFPVDRGSYRILVRHGWIDPTADYDEARSVLERAGDGDPVTLTRLSAALERVGREFCRPRVAKCERCPLRPFLPEGGAIEPEPS